LNIYIQKYEKIWFLKVLKNKRPSSQCPKGFFYSFMTGKLENHLL
jgi:hypothetical protein